MDGGLFAMDSTPDTSQMPVWKARGRRGVPSGRGIAGVTRRLTLMKAIAKSKKDGVKKADRLNIKGPLTPLSEV